MAKNIQCNRCVLSTPKPHHRFQHVLPRRRWPDACIPTTKNTHTHKTQARQLLYYRSSKFAALTACVVCIVCRRVVSIVDEGDDGRLHIHTDARTHECGHVRPFSTPLQKSAAVATPRRTDQTHCAWYKIVYFTKKKNAFDMGCVLI